MAKKKGKGQRIEDQNKLQDTKKSRETISQYLSQDLIEAISNFNAISQEERSKRYGDNDYLLQFRAYFKETYPNLLDKIEKKDLPVYFDAFKSRGFTLEDISKNGDALHDAFKPEGTELQAMQSSIIALKKFCANPINKIPSDVRNEFASSVMIDPATGKIDTDSHLKVIDDLQRYRKQYAQTKMITLSGSHTVKLSDLHVDSITKILTPDFNPTERIMVDIAISKIAAALPPSLRSDFDVTFPGSVDVFSDCQDLNTFSDMRRDFIDGHKSHIDEPLAKALDSIQVTNQDIFKTLVKSGKPFDATVSYKDREAYYKNIFNNLVTRQLFDEVLKTQDTIDHYISALGDTFKEFPPYVNEILNIYRFNSKNVSQADPSFDHDINDLLLQIADLESKTPASSSEDQQQIIGLKQQVEERRWQGYVCFLKSKDAALGDIFTALVSNNFDFSQLSSHHQQYLIDVLVKHKLEDTIKNKVPELLDVKEEEITKFVNDLFDLKKMEIVIPTRDGPVPLSFDKKGFLASSRKHLPTIDDLQSLSNLPLNFVAQLTEANAPFFEDSPIFDSIYTDFSAKNGSFRINDSYKVRITRNGKPVEGYLSAFCPFEEFNENREDRNGKELYLYTHPVTAPSQERDLVMRPQESGNPGVPVVIKDEEQSLCDVEVLDKKLNLNGEAFGALLFGYVLGQQSRNTVMSPEKEKELAEKIGKLKVYREKDEEEEKEESLATKPQGSKEQLTAEQQFIAERKKLKGFPFPLDGDSGFVPGTRLFIPFSDSEVPPERNGKARLQMEIASIDKAKGTFKVRLHGGELRLGKSEGETKELPLSPLALKSIQDAFGTEIYKMPPMKGISFQEQMNRVSDSSLSKDLDKYFGSVQSDGSRFSYALGNFSGKEITHFGLYQPLAHGESVSEETGKLILYKVKLNSNGTVTVSGDPRNDNYAKRFPSRDMDYVSFMLFISEKKLQPKCKEQVDAISANIKAEKEETPTTIRGFSINNIMSFFKNSVSKLKDSIKKYDEERTEELTDLLTSQGQLWGKIGGIFSPFSRISESFENMGMEQYLERDGRIRKKVDKRVRYYDDMDYTYIYKNFIGPMLEGKIKIHPHYKIAAMLLIHLKKGKGPYAKDPSMTAKGQRVGALLGKEHQARYLAIREKKIRDLEENAHIYGGPWADQIKNELVELEMRYIVHVMDGRHMGVNDGDKTKYYFQGKYSKKFCDELETSYTSFFKQGTVEEGFSKNQDVNFEFARFEYFRQLFDRPQQALPFLKVMATKAVNDSQREAFEAAVLAGILSGVFLTMTYGSTQSFIQKICRTRGFLPGLFVKDIKQQSKMQRLLDLFSGNDFSKTTKYNPANYSFRTTTSAKSFINDFVNGETGRLDNPKRMYDLSKFLQFTGGNVHDKTILDLYSDPATSPSDKLLLKEYIDKKAERHESLDPQVQENTFSLTGSILTKSQSVVSQMIRIDQTGFAGKTGDDVQNMEAFSNKMKEAIEGIPSDASVDKVKFFMDIFFNRFPVFSGNKKSELIKRLLRCQQNISSPEVDSILYYSIIGEILPSISAHESLVPEELEGALSAWKNFFKNNMNVILDPSVIASTFGPNYVTDLKYKPFLMPRENSVKLLDSSERAILSNEEKKAAQQTQKILKRTDCLNGSLYKVADLISKKCSIANKFRQEAHISAVTPKGKRKPTGVKLKNPETAAELTQLLQSESPNPDATFSHDAFPESYENDYLDMTA